jgi:peptide/nickel transport system substrate-binding protein
VLVVLAVVTCGLLLSIGSVAHAAKDRVVVAFGSNIPTLDPHMHSSRLAHIADYHLYDTLLYRSPKDDYKPGPGLATAIRSLNPTTWELKLRQGVKFHNGEPFNAEAVKFTIDRVLDPATKSVTRGNLTWIKEVKIVDEYTVQLLTEKPFPAAPEFLTLAYIVPPKYLKSVGNEEFSRKPIGTGPYKHVEWRKAEHLIVEANKEYWKDSPKGMPQIKTIVFRTIPETTTQIAELLSGGVDIIRNVPPDQIEVVKSSPNARISATRILRVNFLKLDSFGRASQTPLTNQKVREAMAYAINVDEMLSKILGGYAERTGSGVNPMHFGYDGAVKPYPYDPERAKKLLAEAGYPNGFEVGYDTTIGRYPQDKEIAEVVVGQLAKVGIKVNLQAFEWGAFYDGVRAKKRAPIHDIGMSSEFFDADNTMSLHFKKGTIWSRWDNPEFDKLVVTARSTMNEKARLQALWRAGEIQHEEAPMVFLHQVSYLYGVNKRVKNWQPTNTEPILIWDAWVE